MVCAGRRRCRVDGARTSPKSPTPNGLTFQLADKDIIVSLGETGTLTLTPEQTEGPYYPVAMVADFDNDLTVVSEQSNPANEPVSAEAAVAFTLLNLNMVTGDQISAAIPNFPNRMVREFLEYRPYVSIQQFRREIGKYVGDTQTAEWEQYVYVPIDINNADAATLMQIPGVDEATANSLIAARPFASRRVPGRLGRHVVGGAGAVRCELPEPIIMGHTPHTGRGNA